MTVKWQRKPNNNLWSQTPDGLCYEIEKKSNSTVVLRCLERISWNGLSELRSTPYRTERGAKIAVGRMYSDKQPVAQAATAVAKLEQITEALPVDGLDADPTIAELKALGFDPNGFNLPAIAEVLRGWLERDVDLFGITGMVEEIAQKHVVKGGKRE